MRFIALLDVASLNPVHHVKSTMSSTQSQEGGNIPKLENASLSRKQLQDFGLPE